MGNVHRETFTKSLPAGAEVTPHKGHRIARWIDRVTPTEAGDRLLIPAATYTAKYRDGSGLLVKTATDCRTMEAAKAVLMELQTWPTARGGMWTATEDAVLDYQTTLLAGPCLDHVRRKR